MVTAPIALAALAGALLSAPALAAPALQDALQGRSHKDDGLVDDAKSPTRRAAKAVRKTTRRVADNAPSGPVQPRDPGRPNPPMPPGGPKP